MLQEITEEEEIFKKDIEIVLISIKSLRHKEFFYGIKKEIFSEFCIIHVKKLLEKKFGIKDYNFILTHKGQIVKDNIHLENLKDEEFDKNKTIYLHLIFRN